MNSYKDLNSEEIRKWWNNQAKLDPDSAGILQVFGGDRLSFLYRQASEWNHFKRIAKLRKNSQVLELGCGAGRWALLISPWVKRVIAVDISEEMVRLVAEKARLAKTTNLSFSVEKAQDFITSEKFDIIYLSGVSQYLNDTALRKLIANARTMLAPGGCLIDRVTLSHGNRFYAEDSSGYRCVYRPLIELKSLFQEQGFSQIYQAPTHQNLRISRLKGLPWATYLLVKLLLLAPRATSGFLSLYSSITDKLKPKPSLLTDRSHDFVSYHLK